MNVDGSMNIIQKWKETLEENSTFKKQNNYFWGEESETINDLNFVSWSMKNKKKCNHLLKQNLKTSFEFKIRTLKNDLRLTIKFKR